MVKDDLYVCKFYNVNFKLRSITFLFVNIKLFETRFHMFIITKKFLTKPLSTHFQALGGLVPIFAVVESTI